VTWLIKKPKPKRADHRCKLPRIWPWTRTGARWMCDECEWIWEIVKLSDNPGWRDWELKDSRTERQRFDEWYKSSGFSAHLDGPPEEV
jgi:hypothetical protein